ncbi:hypothetical protein BO82DRAFT_205041 [Aspergillus uvarum CBS 121591]|uniref:NB-ARC domain-containing protein n=1 Tax=Aspergillus uvarum CBS 121591 TaxID=1448315 RepID=A0A319D936_9EURO|nr:hypothetical protein BO82DRAFT_205041 [Aspergillus uvarum CBS 121591]PYH76482.1 hypothetical protein BO82DRAFT_205041 [Aspergillus uvarum CBS 121591]
MIFDGADGLHLVPLLKYFSVCPRGHIIIMSRDPIAIGVLAPAGQTLEPFKKHTTVELLLEKAAISNAMRDNLEQAGAITKGLGYLPLAVNQAGAFIQRRQKSLKNYHHLFQKKKYKILKISPGISGYDNTVAAVLYDLRYCWRIESI